jgi:hypothetical protein
MRTWLTVITVLAAITACGGGEEGGPLSRAFCADLDNGLTLMNLWPRDQDPADFASDAWGYIATTCPEHYAPNRDYFDQWGLPTIEP